MTECYVANHAAIAHDAFVEETVLINHQRGTYFSLRASAPAIWGMVQTPVTLDGLLSALSAAHGELPPEAPAAVAEMLDRLCEEGCVIRTDAAASTPAAVAPMPGGRFMPPQVQTFHDLEDLVSIDPVHEAHEFTGWPNRPPTYPVEQ